MQANREPEHVAKEEIAPSTTPAQPLPRSQQGGILHRWPGGSHDQESLPSRSAQAEPEPRTMIVPQPAMNAAQIVMSLVGIMYVGIGAVGLARGGFESLNLHGHVMGIPHTPLLGFMELIFGAVVVLAAALPYAGRWVLLIGGSLMFIMGLIIAIAPGSLNAALGVEMLNGWMYMLTGVVTVLVGIIMPRTAEWRRGR